MSYSPTPQSGPCRGLVDLRIQASVFEQLRIKSQAQSSAPSTLCVQRVRDAL